MPEQTEPPETDVSLPTKTIDADDGVEDRLTDNVIENVLPARYLDKNVVGDVIETPAEMFERVAANVAAAEDEHGGDYHEWRGRFEAAMTEQRFMPNSPTLMNAGLDLQQLSACFVDSPADDLDDIAQTEKEWTMIQKTGGGIGGSFSDLRPKGTLIESTKGTTSGPVSFMRKFNLVAGVIKQGGKRRGAQMAIMRADHPDIGRFVVAKREEGAYDNFNISVGLTDDFVAGVRSGGLYALNDPRDDFDAPFEAVEATKRFYHPRHEDEADENIWQYADEIRCTNGETLRERWADSAWDVLLNGDMREDAEMMLPARFLWDIIVDGAWRNGEPGLFYLDETNREHSFDVAEHPEYEIKGTNPCAEQPLCEYEACNLGHVNLSLMKVDGVEPFTAYDGTVREYMHYALDFQQLDETIETGVRFLDNVVTQSEFPLEDIEERVTELRKIGLGVMGWAQLLYQMGIPYGSDESIELGQLLMRYIDRRATQASHELALERGSFEAWEDSKYANPAEYPEWFEDHTHEPEWMWAQTGYPIRNHNVTTVAPTGTTSLIGDTSGGIEPVYNVAYQKHVGDDIGVLVEFDSYFEQALEANGYDVDAITDEAADMMARGDYDGPHDLPISDELADVFVTTQDVSPEGHTMMQRAFQANVDSGISKTINLPNEATRADVASAYRLALDADADGSPAKGITVYRDQSRREQVLTTREHSEKDVEAAIELVESQGYDVVEGETAVADD